MSRLKLLFFAIIFLFTLFAVMLSALNDNDDITIGKYRKFHSNILSEDRTIFVHLPRDYESSTLEYPVIYLLYCNAVELYYASSVSTIHPLQDIGKIPEFILIGVGDTGHRYRDYLPVLHRSGPGQADNFAKFFKEELIPFVNKNYRTKDYRLVVGPQSSSVFGVYTLLKYPELFSAAIVSNPFNPYYGSAETLINLAQNSLKPQSASDKFLFISYYENEKESFVDMERFNKIIDLQKPDKFRYHVNKSAEDDAYEDVFLKKALLTLFDKFEIPSDLKIESLADLQKYYNQVSEYYGYQVNIPSLIITFKVENLINQGKFNPASEILDYALKINPKDSNSIFRKAMLSTSLGDLETAIVYYEKMKEILPNEDIVNIRLQSARKQIAGSAAYRVEKAINIFGLEQGVKIYNEMSKQKPEGIYFDEREFNSLGYRLITRGMTDAALEVFKMNTELYPESANVYDSLAELYMNQGNKELASKFYKKSLELNPKNENAAKKLKELN
jgi:predicted alpha/beta superfamily hydrolase/Flp pilus assembly protein TadD